MITFSAADPVVSFMIRTFSLTSFKITSFCLDTFPRKDIILKEIHVK